MTFIETILFHISIATLPSVEKNNPQLHSQIVNEFFIYIRHTPRALQILLSTALIIINFVPLFFWRSRFTHLEYEKKYRLINSLITNPIYLIRQSIKGITILIQAIYYDREETMNKLNYTPGQFIHEKIAYRKSILKTINSKGSQ